MSFAMMLEKFCARLLPLCVSQHYARNNGGFIAVALLASSCQAHVLIPTAPTGQDAYVRRVRYYNQFRSVTTQAATGGYGTQVLANGAVIAHPRDLLPALDPQSNGALALQSEADAYAAGSVVTGVSLVVAALAGIGLGGYAAYNSASGSRGSTGLYIALGVTTLFGLTTASVTPRFTQAFSTVLHQHSIAMYEPSLRERLQLCDSPNELGPLRDCNVPPPAPTTDGYTLPPMQITGEATDGTQHMQSDAPLPAPPPPARTAGPSLPPPPPPGP
jgi:hypothetical protein